MKSEELMLDDWVSYKGKMPCKITAICKDTAVVDNDTTQDWRIDYDNLTPIPLTKEILKKNGFDVSDKEVVRYYFEEDGEKYHFSLRQMYDKDGKPHGYSFYSFNVLTLLDYVHELQHALRLCGINKDIKL